jgi:hypothetical protein
MFGFIPTRRSELVNWCCMELFMQSQSFSGSRFTCTPDGVKPLSKREFAIISIAISSALVAVYGLIYSLSVASAK